MKSFNETQKQEQKQEQKEQHICRGRFSRINKKRRHEKESKTEKQTQPKKRFEILHG